MNSLKNTAESAKRAGFEKRLRKSISDSILSENKLTVGNLNDYANLALRCGDKDANAFGDWAAETFDGLDKSTVFSVVVTTKDDIDDGADYVYEADGGFAANFYKD